MTIDTTQIDIAALQDVDDDELLRLLRAIGEVRGVRLEQKLLAAMKELIAKEEELDLADVKEVVFTTTEWDNGWFYYPDEATLRLTDGSKEVFDFRAVDRLLTDVASATGCATATARSSLPSARRSGTTAG